jgi:hypothetical protein
MLKFSKTKILFEKEKIMKENIESSGIFYFSK